MRKVKLLVLTAMSALALVGCGGKTGTLPSGGKDVDVTNEEGQATLKERLSAVEKAYTNSSFDSASLKAVTSGVSVNAKANAESDATGKIDLEVGLNDFGGELELKAAKHAKGEDEEYDSVDASLVAKTTSGKLSIKGNVPGKEENTTAKLDASLALKGAEVDAYVTGSKAYVDISKSGNDKLIGDIDTFGNTLLGQLKESAFGPLLSFVVPSDIPEEVLNRKELKLTLADYYKETVKDKKLFLEMGQPIEWPTAKEEESSKKETNFDGFIETVTEFAKQKVGFQFKTYSGNGFGLALAMNKESLVNFAKMNAETEEEAKDTAEKINKYVSKFTFNADVYFNKDALLESAGASFSLEAKLDKSLLGESSESFKSFDATISAKATEKVEVKYGGVKVNLPDFADYKEFKLFAK